MWDAPMPLSSVFSIDVEDYFHDETFTGVISRESWDGYPCRVERNTRKLLDLLNLYDVKGTFFILGWVAERYPRLVQEIASYKHEIACHSYWHRLVYRLSPEEFREDTLRAKDTLEQTIGEAVYGYRAPTYSITRKSLWAFDILAESGFKYDSSVFPIHHDRYGIPDAPRMPFTIRTNSGPIVEFPGSTFRVLGTNNLPVGGGGYLRLFPFWYTQFGVRRLLREGLPLIVYTHPWEVDPEQPRVAAGRLQSLRHYTNLGSTYERLKALLTNGGFGSFRESGWIDHTLNQKGPEWLRTQ
jgi:polysaccharide deacetylase family protein (PEP-CTERM system associated)